MNIRNQELLSMERSAKYHKMLEGAGDTGRSSHVLAEPVLEAFLFGPFRLVPHARLLERDKLPLSLGSRAFDLLCALVNRPGEVVSKGDLIATVWPNIAVEESSLRFHIIQLRRALAAGDSQAGQSYVRNVPGRGYCFVAPVRRSISNGPSMSWEALKLSVARSG